MNQEWFEMETYKKRSLNVAVWIPLRCIESNQTGQYGEVGYIKESFGSGSVAFPLGKKEEAESIEWSDIGNKNTGGFFIDGKYVSSEVYIDSKNKGLEGVHLVIEQSNNGKINGDWYINPDLIVSLRLYRESDVWLCPDDGYVEVIKLSRNSEGTPVKIEIKAEYLKDYLCAREMGLYITWYRERDEIFEDVKHIVWAEDGLVYEEKNLKWEGRVIPIHEGGENFGSTVAVFHVTRTDVDFEEDVPSISFPTNQTGVDSKNFEKTFSGKKLFRVIGEMYRNEWIEPSNKSPRVRGDNIPASILFIVDSAGNKESGNILKDEGKWLWFKPEIVETLLRFRDGQLAWYTKNTGNVGADNSGAVHFGINELGLINVYAKDIGYLPEWQQSIWAGFNIGPEGGVSKELMQAQAVGRPANTVAPERYLGNSLIRLNDAIKKKYGVEAFRHHNDITAIVENCHRFRATDFNGLLSLAKDLARLTADSLDKKELQKMITLPEKEKLGSLKSLEKLIALSTGDEKAKKLMGPLFGIYDLRLADAHLAGTDLQSAFNLMRINQTDPTITQGYTMLHHTVSVLSQITHILESDSLL